MFRFEAMCKFVRAGTKCCAGAPRRFRQTGLPSPRLPTFQTACSTNVPWHVPAVPLPLADCDTCRWMAPDTFGRVGQQSAVVQQPADREGRVAALKALLSCPT